MVAASGIADMARIRTIKPNFFTSEDIVALSPMARLLYIALWCEADREGRLVWKPKTFKLRYFPSDRCDIDALARELHASRLVILYGDGLAFIPSFLKHQHINPRESASCLPEPDASALVDDASAREAHAQGGREGKGREGKEGASGRKKPLPENFTISESVKAWAAEKGHSRLPEHLEAFKVKARAKGYTYVDWDSAFMEAVRNDWAKLPAAQNNGQRKRL
jgi:hypothetical protein